MSGDRRTLRRHLLNFDAGTVTREMQGDISAGLFTVLIASLDSIDNQKRHGMSRREEGQRNCDRPASLATGIPTDQYLLANGLGFPVAR